MALGGDGAEGVGETLGDLADDEEGAAHAGAAQEGEETVGEGGERGAVEGGLGVGGVEFLEVDGEEEGFHWEIANC
jgi:hypothetical protein